MSLNWDVSRVENMEAVCYHTKEDGKYLNDITEKLIWMTMTVGLGEITEKNWKKFYNRVHLDEKLNGARRSQIFRDNDDKLICYPETDIPLERPIFIKRDEVKAHIGLSTNVSNEPTVKWLKRTVKYSMPRGEENEI